MMSRFFKRLVPAAVVVVGLGGGIMGGDSGPALVPFQPTVHNGDWDGDGSRNVTDVIQMVHWLFLGDAPAAAPVACRLEGDPGYSDEESSPTRANGDLDGSGSINITDVICLIDFLYLGGQEPAEIECDPEFAASDA